ncbi:MAG: DUF2147 domain-containing protein [Fimbriimonadaceae bacterium]|nr:DUF2147 domain-containing protein [Alphaproteobacteria bacterium]
MINRGLLTVIGLAASLLFSINLAFSENSSGTSEPLEDSASNSMSPIGIWHKREATTKVEIYRCGLAHCGKIVYLRSPIDPKTGEPRLDNKNPDASVRNRPLLGANVLLNMIPVGQNFYEGKIYNAEDGRTYSGNITQIDPDRLKLNGCVLGGLICKSEKMVRASSS